MRVDDESQPDEAANDLAGPAAMTGFVRGGSDQGDVKPVARRQLGRRRRDDAACECLRHNQRARAQIQPVTALEVDRSAALTKMYASLARSATFSSRSRAIRGCAGVWAPAREPLHATASASGIT